MNAFVRPFVNGFKITIVNMPDFGSVPTVLVQVLAAPAFQAVFYVLLAQGGLAAGLGETEADAAGSVAGTAASGNAAAQGAALAAMIGASCVAACTCVASVLAQERFEGTMPYVMATTRAGFLPWAGRFAAMLAVTFLSGCAAMAAAAVTTDFSGFGPAQWGLTLLLLLVAVVSSCGMGLLVAACSLLFADALALTNIVGQMLPLIGGVVAPVSVFGGPIGRLLHIMPIAWSTDAARALAAGGTPTALTDMAAALLSAALWAILAAVVWRVCITQSRRHDRIKGLGL